MFVNETVTIAYFELLLISNNSTLLHWSLIDKQWTTVLLSDSWKLLNINIMLYLWDNRWYIVVVTKINLWDSI